WFGKAARDLPIDAVDLHFDGANAFFLTDLMLDGVDERTACCLVGWKHQRGASGHGAKCELAHDDVREAVQAYVLDNARVVRWVRLERDQPAANTDPPRKEQSEDPFVAADVVDRLAGEIEPLDERLLA